MRKSFWCKMGFHDWEIAESKYKVTVNDWLHKKVCLRDGCDEVYDEIAADKQRREEEHERRRRAIRKYKAITEGKPV